MAKAVLGGSETYQRVVTESRPNFQLTLSIPELVSLYRVLRRVGGLEEKVTDRAAGDSDILPRGHIDAIYEAIKKYVEPTPTAAFDIATAIYEHVEEAWIGETRGYVDFVGTNRQTPFWKLRGPESGE